MALKQKQGNISTILAREKKTILDKLLTSNIYKHLLTLLYLILLSLSYTISLSLSPFPLDFEVADEPFCSDEPGVIKVDFFLLFNILFPDVLGVIKVDFFFFLNPNSPG